MVVASGAASATVGGSGPLSGGSGSAGSWPASDTVGWSAGPGSGGGAATRCCPRAVNMFPAPWPASAAQATQGVAATWLAPTTGRSSAWDRVLAVAAKAARQRGSPATAGSSTASVTRRPAESEAAQTVPTGQVASAPSSR
ncbi:hypothetical protein [Polymorphospora sp. A560]|uniref:hypothetical protein n=1 Tax=Polymorphospora sp. A560 TaxID=3040203 RepID=UPI003891AF2D